MSAGVFPGVEGSSQKSDTWPEQDCLGTWSGSQRPECGQAHMSSKSRLPWMVGGLFSVSG